MIFNFILCKLIFPTWVETPVGLHMRKSKLLADGHVISSLMIPSFVSLTVMLLSFWTDKSGQTV